MFIFFFGSFWRSFATRYLYFYGVGCPHCHHVNDFFQEKGIEEKFSIEKKEVQKNRANSLIFAEYIKALGLDARDAGVPFLVITEDDKSMSYKVGSTPIIDYFTEQLKKGIVGDSNEDTSILDTTPSVPVEKKSTRSLIITLITTSLADSINPCVFAVMLLLLSTILMKSKSRKKAVLSGLMFVFAIFLGYTFLGKVLVELLSSIWRESSQAGYWIQMIVGILGVVIGVANLKDFFFPNILPPMEVPMSRRPRMQKIIKGVLSPRGAFGIGVILTAFLLPCTAGPYMTFALHLSSYPDIMQSARAYYVYLLVYNIIFILPMLGILAIVWFWCKTVEELGSLRKKYRTIVHLIVGILMFGLGIYILSNIL